MADDQRRAARIGSLEKLGITERKLSTMKVREMTDLQRAKFFKISDAAKLSTALKLTPGKPRQGDSHLSFYTPVLVLTENIATNDLAMFSSAVPGFVFPGAQIEFAQIKKNKPHLVEFQVSLFDKTKTYKFRVFHYPLGQFQDISLTGAQTTIPVLVPATPNFDGELGASIQQRNTVGDNAGWALYAVRVTSIS